MTNGLPLDPVMLATILGALVPTLGGIILAIWRQGHKAGIHEHEIAAIKKEVYKIDSLEHRLTIIETRFEPFLRVIEESISRLVPGNPIDASLIEKIKNNNASTKEIECADLYALKEVEWKDDDPFKLIILRYWLKIKRVEAEEREKSGALEVGK